MCGLDQLIYQLMQARPLCSQATDIVIWRDSFLNTAIRGLQSEPQVLPEYDDRNGCGRHDQRGRHGRAGEPRGCRDRPQVHEVLAEQPEPPLLSEAPVHSKSMTWRAGVPWGRSATRVFHSFVSLYASSRWGCFNGPA